MPLCLTNPVVVKNNDFLGLPGFLLLIKAYNMIDFILREVASRS